MLVLSRKIGEVITIGSSVKITVLSYDRGVVRVGIEAPKNIPVHRKEVYDRIVDLNRKSSRTELQAFKTALSDKKLNIKDDSGKFDDNSIFNNSNNNKEE